MRLAIQRARCGAALAAVLLLSCRAPFDPTDHNPDWTDASHGLATPNYAVVFPQDNVNRIDIRLGAAAWSAIRTNMTALWGFDFGDGNHPCCGGSYGADADYVDVEVEFNGKVWKHVGFRPKGHSTLHHAWNGGNYKFPFRLKFDAYEDAHPETWNQRFYGFREISMSANIFDNAMMKERLASDLFRAGGVPAPRTAYYRVYIDFGNGLEYNGVYTIVELPDDSMVQDQLGERGGNLYKPESHLSTFDASDFPRQNNQESQDYSDVQALIAAVNNTALQASNATQWRANLEAVFNVEGFLKFLAVNNAMANWDAYGAVAHNYYLYNHSAKKLTWIPWDQNLSFNENPGVIGPGPGSALSLTMNEVSSSWPLIRNLADDPVYFGLYRTYLQWFSANAFAQSTVDALINKYAGMIQPFVNAEIPGHGYVSPGEFSDWVNVLRGNVRSRREVIEQFLR
jgi:spore coat protein H